MVNTIAAGGTVVGIGLAILAYLASQRANRIALEARQDAERLAKEQALESERLIKEQGRKTFELEVLRELNDVLQRAGDRGRITRGDGYGIVARIQFFDDTELSSCAVKARQGQHRQPSLASNATRH